MSQVRGVLVVQGGPVGGRGVQYVYKPGGHVGGTVGI